MSRGRRDGIFSVQPVDARSQQSMRRQALTVLGRHEICKKQEEELFVGMKLGEPATCFPGITASPQMCSYIHTYASCSAALSW